MTAKDQVAPVDQELTFLPDEIIVSKTDLRGRITYANDVFCRLAEMSTDALIGQPHSVIRHPDMPRAVFKLLWDRISAGHEIFAYVKNMSATGKYYWVIAHVTPTRDASGQITGYHSNRRVPTKAGLDAIMPLYAELLRIEGQFPNSKDGLEASSAYLQKLLGDTGMDYDRYIWSVAA